MCDNTLPAVKTCMLIIMLLVITIMKDILLRNERIE